jgi:hypothetical protein
VLTTNKSNATRDMRSPSRVATRTTLHVAGRRLQQLLQQRAWQPANGRAALAAYLQRGRRRSIVSPGHCIFALPCIYCLHAGQPGRNGRHRHLHAPPHGDKHMLAAKPIARAYLGSLRVRGDDEPLLDACLAASFAYMKPLTAGLQASHSQ